MVCFVVVDRVMYLQQVLQKIEKKFNLNKKYASQMKSVIKETRPPCRWNDIPCLRMFFSRILIIKCYFFELVQSLERGL